MTNEKVIMLIEAKIQPQHRAELVEAAHEYLPFGAGGGGCGSVLHSGPKGRSQYVCFLRGLQVASSAGLPSAARLHEEIPGDVKERAGGRPNADKSCRVGPGRTDTFQLARLSVTGNLECEAGGIVSESSPGIRKL